MRIITNDIIISMDYLYSWGGGVEGSRKRASPSSSTVLILLVNHGNFDEGYFEFKAIF